MNCNSHELAGKGYRWRWCKEKWSRHLLPLCIINNHSKHTDFHKWWFGTERDCGNSTKGVYTDELKFHWIKSQLYVVVIHTWSERSSHYPRCRILFTMNFIKYSVIEITVISCKRHYIVTYCLSFQTHPDTSSLLICSLLNMSRLRANVLEWVVKHLNPGSVCFKTNPSKKAKNKCKTHAFAHAFT